MIATEKPCWIEASWPAPDHVRAGTTTRLGGFSQAPYDSLNLAGHVGDKDSRLADNRQHISQQLELPSAPLWLKQVHGNHLVDESEWREDIEADACSTRGTNVVCAVLTADCLPLLLCNRAGDQVAAIHLGWRGLANDLLDKVVKAFSAKPADLLAWIGPHIRQPHYEVGKDVYQLFVDLDSGTNHAFQQQGDTKWLLSLAGLTETRLRNSGISMIYDCEACTYADSRHFFSYRRQKLTGRMATLIWIDSAGN